MPLPLLSCYISGLGPEGLLQLDVVEGIAGETVIELTQEEKEIREKYDSDKKMYT